MFAPSYEEKDWNGRRIRIGDTGQIVGVPDSTGMTQECAAESLPVFAHVARRYEKVARFDE